MIGFALAALLLSAGPDPLEVVERAQQEIFNRIAPGVVFISNGDGFSQLHPQLTCIARSGDP